MPFNKIAKKTSLTKTVKSLKENGINVVVAENNADALKKVLEMIPEKSEVMTMTSVTVDSLGISAKLNDSGKYSPVRAKFAKMDHKTQGLEMRRLGAGPEFVVGSVNAVTEDGHVIIASATGSQIPAYAYGASKVIWVVGTQKIVKDLNEGFKRINKYVLPLESERAKKAYGVAGSSVNKILVVNKEVVPDRITIIFLNEVIGF